MIGVFGYLTWRSVYNRIVRQLRHLRSPRYLAALLLDDSALLDPGTEAANTVIVRPMRTR